MHRLLSVVIVGLCLVGGFTVGALVWPVGSQMIASLGRQGEFAIPVPPDRFDRTRLRADLMRRGHRLGDELHLRLYKREHRLDVFMRGPAGRFIAVRSYPICNFSGALGPKLAEGDRQAPEGFYRVTARQLNPHSRHHLAFNLGFPNAYDEAHGRTGSYLMIHGGCSSVGCYAMTDENIDEIYAMVEAALAAGQAAVDVAIFPFELTETALQAEASSPWLPFWENLKAGADLFAREGRPPAVGVCDGRYVFGAAVDDPSCTPIAGWA